jgi:inorganic triphosphatase YgiF
VATEIELKLAIGRKAARQLIEHPQLLGHPPQRLRLLNTYYDTPELALHGQRMALRFRKKGDNWLLTVKTAEAASGGLAVRQEWEYPAQPGEFDFTPIDQPALRQLLERQRPQLRPVFSTNFTRLVWQLQYGAAKIEMALDRGWVISEERRHKIHEVELELLDGPIADLFAFARLLQDDVALRPAIGSKAETGYRLFKRTPARPARATPSPVQPGQTPIAACRAIALACLAHLQRNETGILAELDPEYIHQARVAIRRLRSVMALFAPLLPAGFQKTFGKPWKQLARVLGEARNWDVFINETLPPILAAFPDDKNVTRLLKAARRRRQIAGRVLVKQFGHANLSRLWLDFTAALYALPEAEGIDLVEFARRQIAEQSEHTRQLAERFAKLNAEQRHQLRLAYKKLRYTSDFMAPLFSQPASTSAGARQADTAPPQPLSVTTLSRLQDALGQINDLITARQLLATLPGAARAARIDGWLAGRHQLLTEQLPSNLAAWRAAQA